MDETEAARRPLVLTLQLAQLAGAPPFAVEVTGLEPLGRGVAYRLTAAPAQQLRRHLQERWRADLTRQDAQPFRPHVTVQNKVSPETARATQALRRWPLDLPGALAVRRRGLHRTRQTAGSVTLGVSLCRAGRPDDGGAAGASPTGGNRHEVECVPCT